MKTKQEHQRVVNYKITRKMFNESYLPYLTDETRTQIFFGGSSSGKSVFLAQRCIIDIANGGRNYLIVRKTARTLHKSVFNELCKVIQRFKMADVFPTINKTDMSITCVNGYQILFAGLDDTEKIKSITPQKGVITDIWVEEATETDEDDISQLNKRLRGLTGEKEQHQKRMILSFNPILQAHWIYNKYFGGWQDNTKLYRGENILILKTTYKDNQFLAPDDIAALENETDKYYYDVYTLGNWGVLGDVIYKNWHVQDLSDMRDQFTNRKHGLDFGFSKDPAAMPCTHYDRKRKTIYIYDELYMTELTNDLLADEIKAKIRNDYVTCDSAEPKSIKELQQHGVSALAARKGKDSVNHGIQWLQQQTIVVDVHCQNTKNELQAYQWKQDKNGVTLRVPVDVNNHLMDALRYAYEDEYRLLDGIINIRV